MTSKAISNWGLGLNADAMPSELPEGYCTSAINMRFRNGYAERIGGTTDIFASPPAVVPYWIGLHGNTAGAAGFFAIYAGLTKVYANDTVTETEITRYTDGVAISSITFVLTTATLTTASAHGRTTGDIVTVYAALPTDYNFTGAVTVTSPTTFTYTMATTPATDATTVGAYSYNVTSNFTSSTDNRWSGGTLNGVFFLNHPVDGLYYWTGTGRLKKMPLASASNVTRAFKSYLIQLEDRNVRWSAAAEPGSIPSAFDAGSTNDAGRDPLAESDGKVVDCLPMGDVNVIYTEDARYAMRWVGGNDVFSVQRMPGGDGVATRSCVVDTPKGHVFLTKNGDVMLHNGGQAVSLAEGRVRSQLVFSVSSAKTAFLAANPRFNEVWVCFDSSGAGVPNKALIWNWKDDTWGHKALSSVTCATSGLVGTYSFGQYLLMANTTPKLGVQDYGTSNISTGATHFNATFTSTIERTGLNLGADFSVKNLARSRPAISSNGSVAVSVYHGSSMFPNTAPTYQAAQTYTVGTSQWANATATGGPFLALKMTFSPSDVGNISMKFKTWLIDYTESGVV
jgi:hypothetical protein